MPHTNSLSWSMPNQWDDRSSYVSTMTSFQCQQGYKLLIDQYQNQWARFHLLCFNTDQLSMSAQIQALNWSIPKPMDTISARMFQRWPAFNVNTDTSSLSINTKTNGHNFSYSIINNDQLSMSARIQAINRLIPKPMGTISASMVQRGPNYSITIIKVVSIPTNVYL